MALNARQTVELFHLSFLRALVAKGEDKALIALKGGCNLRFFFGSVRYSEDIDFDVVVIAKETLKRKVERLLQSPLVTAALRAKAVEIGEVSATKQTMTTQRWKLALRNAGSSVAFRTKLEFSREKRVATARLPKRDEVERTEFAAVDSAVLRAYGLTPFLATHYTTVAAIEQKIRALAGRTEPQARDVFDLNLLFARPEATHAALSAAGKHAIPTAIDRALGLSFDEYRATVVAYLEPQQSALYDGRAAWEAMQSAVLTKLEALS